MSQNYDTTLEMVKIILDLIEPNERKLQQLMTTKVRSEIENWDFDKFVELLVEYLNNNSIQYPFKQTIGQNDKAAIAEENQKWDSSNVLYWLYEGDEDLFGYKLIRKEAA